MRWTKIGGGSVLVAAAFAFGCSSVKSNMMGSSGTGDPSSNPGSSTTGSGQPAASGSGQTSSGSAGMSSSGMMTSSNPKGSGGSSSSSGPGSSASSAGSGATEPASNPAEKLDPNVDWTALKLVYSPMYSAFDGKHTFKVPVHVDGTTVELSGWKAIPASAVSFDPDPSVAGGVTVTVLQAEPEITIAATNGTIGGMAPLRITSGTPEDWAAGEARYNNGVEFTLMIDFSQIVDPNWMPPIPPPNLACNNCHSTGAKYLEIQHTPTQEARFSDDELSTIFSKGMKPPGVGFRVLPAMVGNMTDVDLYAAYHKWDATPQEIKGLIIYLRSLTPTGMGDILLPDGTYAPPGGMPSGAGGAGK